MLTDYLCDNPPSNVVESFEGPGHMNFPSNRPPSRASILHKQLNGLHLHDSSYIASNIWAQK
jgi:hypothetical protein